MFRLLIVEDDHATCRQLQTYLSEGFLHNEEDTPVQIDTAETVSEAKKALEMAFVSKRPYQAIILDFYLPEATGDNAEIDESLCRLVRNFMPSTTLVVHISTFLDDDVILRHMKEVHDEQIDRSFRLSKSDSDWFIQLASKLRAFLYGTQIGEQIDRLFESAGNSELAMGTRRITTYSLAALSRDIVRHWSDLDDSVKDRIQKFFYVDSTTDPIRISLL